MDVWHRLDVGLYAERNYREVLPVDRWLAACNRRWWDGYRGGDYVDIGAGPCLYPSMAATRADTIVAWEYSPSFCDYLADQYRDPAPGWGRFAAYVDAPRDWAHRLASRARVVNAGVADLPLAMFDAATMHFVAECVDGTWAGFAASLGYAVRSLRPGGRLLVAAMECSEDATYGSVTIPVVAVAAADLARALELAGAVDVAVETLAGDDALVREGHRGVLLATARRP